MTIQISDKELRQLDIVNLFSDGISPYPESDNSVKMAFSRGIDFFRDYISKKTIFTNGRVLDLLCGFGRWSLFLAEQNEFVIGIDRLPVCTKIARRLCDYFNISNTEFLTGEAELLIKRFGNCEFDYVWMWSAMQYVNRGIILREIWRILKPGGRLFVSNYNSTGLMVEHILNGIKNGTPYEGASKWAMTAMINGPEGDENPNFSTLETCPSTLVRFGFKPIVVCPDGALDLSQPDGTITATKKLNLIEGRYVRTIEFIAEKSIMPSAQGTKRTISHYKDIIRKLINRKK